MVRGELEWSRSQAGDTAVDWRVPLRLRARLSARAGPFDAQLEVQDARPLSSEPTDSRSGIHQLSFGFRWQLAKGELTLRLGRQEFISWTQHIYANRRWNHGMRSWDGLHFAALWGPGGIELFAGLLARPLLSAQVPFEEHWREEFALTYTAQGYLRLHDALVLELSVAGRHTREANDRRDIANLGTRVRGELPWGLSYQAEGHLQLGRVRVGDRDPRQLAGAGYMQLAWLSERGWARDRSKPGVDLAADFASGGGCQTTQFEGLDPCSDAAWRHDFDSPWTAHHRWFGHADRFRAINVLDYRAGLHLKNKLFAEAELDLAIYNHVFRMVHPGGQWVDVGGDLVAVDPGNRDPWLSNELELNVRWRWRWLEIETAWMLLVPLSGGRALRDEALGQRLYVWALVRY